jgi:hypothetical protein
MQIADSRLRAALSHRSGWPPTSGEIPVMGSRSDWVRPRLSIVSTLHVESPMRKLSPV